MQVEFIRRNNGAYPDVQVHRIPTGFGGFHREYGLWICRFGRGGRSGPAPFRIPRYFEFYCLSHMFDGKGWYWTPEGGLRKVEPGNLLIVTPHQLHGYGGDELPFCEDTVCFTGTVADHLHRSGVLQPGVFSLGPARRLLPIIDLAMDPDVHSQIRANIALQNLIVEIHLNDRKETASERYAGIRSLQEEIRRHPGKWWSVVEMAEYCNLSVVQFRRVFRRVTGMAPKEYVDRYKVRLAADRLYGPAESIGSIARELGYRDPFHFSRRFKQITGCSPEQYRKNRFR